MSHYCDDRCDVYHERAIMRALAASLTALRGQR